MTATIAVVLAAFAAGGALWGWRIGTRNIESPPERYDFPGGMSRGEYLRRLKARHQRRRILLALGAAAVAAGAAFVVLMALALMQRR